MIAYRAMPGEDITYACKEAVALANRHNDTVAFDFNGVHVVVSPGETPSAAVARWNAESERNAEAYRNSPKGKAMKAEQEARRKQCQRITDTLIVALPAVVHDLGALVRWCVAMSKCGDRIDVAWDKSAVADQIEAAGWKIDAHVGRKPEEFDNNPTMMGEYIVGQTLACLRSGKAPRGIIETFARDAGFLQ
jgi:hypothetical protein